MSGVVTFGRFDADKQNEYTDADVMLDGVKRGTITRVTGEPTFGCRTLQYYLQLDDMEPVYFRATTRTPAVKALHAAKRLARDTLTPLASVDPRDAEIAKLTAALREVRALAKSAVLSVDADDLIDICNAAGIGEEAAK